MSRSEETGEHRAPQLGPSGGSSPVSPPGDTQVPVRAATLQPQQISSQAPNHSRFGSRPARNHHLHFKPRKRLNFSQTKSPTMLCAGEGGHRTASLRDVPAGQSGLPKTGFSAFGFTFGPALVPFDLQREAQHTKPATNAKPNVSEG